MGYRIVSETLRFLAVSDPGRLRLRAAATTTITVVLAMAILIPGSHLVGQPLTVALLGAVVAMQSSAAVKDKDQRSRVITTLLLVFPAILAVSLSAVLSQFGKVADVGFIVVLFAAVWVRRYGPRGTALGMVAFICYFFALFLRAQPSQIPVLAVSIVLGVGISLAVRTLVLPERPGLELRRLVRALRAASIDVLEVASNRVDRDLDLLRKRLDRLGSTALMIDDWLDRNDASQLLSVTNEDLSLRIFDAQIATEQLVSALWALDPIPSGVTPQAALPPNSWPSSLVQATTALSSCLQNNPSDDQLRAARRLAAAAADEADPSTQAGIATTVAMRAVQAHIAIHHITSNALHTESAPKEESEKDDDTDSGLNPSTKAAIQVAVATSAATVLGEIISPDRWYWAVLTAFLVFTGASTRGEILSRAGHRVVGTVGGVLAGVLLSALVGRNQPLQLLLLVVCIFFAFYLVTVAYALLSFFVTVMLAMLYGLLGTFSIEVLELRIYETAAGGLVGIASAYFVFSTGTRSTMVEKVDDYLEQMTAIIDTGIDAVITPGRPTDLVVDMRKLDNALKDLVAAGKPLEMGPTTRTRKGVKRLLRIMTVSNRSSHALARAGVGASHAEPDTGPSQETADALRRAAEVTKATIADVGRALAGEHVDPPEKLTETSAPDVMLKSTTTPGPVRSAVRSLSTLNRTMGEALTRV
ncbi:FUSC family protein [Rhodococcus sp. 06-156-3C]|uniref:FUSC family protein n=1 Tax=Nocardiaceae TaxID=85025 RepID=UPI000522E4CE|nr:MULTISPECIES: FUSC family protein [Rhodococcus]OZD14965.1 FUSC family protein [Rhodococcus sp. 06-156-4C]OZD19952.1 FUSC family protein [Rhodococcus sp. 06-156-4a]OZD22740.1 FUSC family protein [Rhodococcus sp. 06-156-3C]OZD25969.1 FUSC family protein [Rhodococcus sp. 06-156-3b]OZD38177.1 FUSC family protein [Rhodococcus sp. 06-156-3]